MIPRATAVLAVVAIVTGCGVAEGTPSEPGTPGPNASAHGAGTAQPRTDIEAALDCYLTDNPDYSRGRGTSQEAAVAEFAGWYPLITRTIRWQEPGVSAPPEGSATTWLLYTNDGRGYGTATVSRPDPRVEEWSATVDRLCVAALPPPPSAYTDRTVDGLSSQESLTDPANIEFVRAMDAALVGLPEGDAADALRAVRWRVRVGKRDGVPQDNVGTASSWINLVIADEIVTGFTVG